MSNKKSKRRTKSPLSSDTSRKKTRTRTRKPKFLSLLHLQLRRVNDATASDGTPSPESVEYSTRQLELFPLETDNLVEFQDKDDINQYDHVSALLLNPTDSSNDATLSGLLNENDPTTSDDGPPASSYSSPSLPYGYCGQGSLVWAAMKGRERREESTDQEKWVRYSEVVAEEASSCYGGGSWTLLDLKLDHEEVLKTWSDKGPLFIGGDQAPHETVPNLVSSLIAAAHVEMEVCENAGGVKDEEKGKRDREASLLRYKEKRRSRLFSKCIRYQVRKLNADKRPRFKGRFVKRESDRDCDR